MPAIRKIKCQICDFKETRCSGLNGVLVDPCPKCGSRVTYAAHFDGDMPVILDPKLTQTLPRIPASGY